ncbi:3'-5' exonuclease KapD [Metabacillus herbersteinensis]|uniref:3'-5' exonuclease KapD n=1 Tax=Metabacillus herbersteinensis TaxID=283816 RepID=A0ABV6GCS7_9BACI
METHHQHLLFVDFEFTMPQGKLNPQGFYPEIIEVGIVSVRNQKIEHQFSSYVKPVKFPLLSDRCKSFLHISQAKVDNGITFYELIELLNNYDQVAPNTVITWGNMDMKVLRQNCQLQNIAFPFSGKFRDLSMEYKKFFGDRNQTGLWKAVEEYGKKGTGRHHCALDDAMTTYNIFKLVEQDKRYLARPRPTTIGERIDLSKVLNKYAT